jgi:hypothetical protein
LRPALFAGKGGASFSCTPRGVISAGENRKWKMENEGKEGESTPSVLPLFPFPFSIFWF